MTKKSISRLLQASLMCCLAVLFTACDDIFASEDNPTPAYLSMSDKPVTIKVGDTYRRKAISVTTAVVEYTSSDTKVATVDGEGMVTAIAEGEATITATATGYSTDGKKIFQADSKSYKLTVKPATLPAATITTAPVATAGDILAGSTTSLVTAGVADGGTMMYQATATNAKPTTTGGFSATVPTAATLAAGTYYVWYYAKADAQHSDSEIAATAIEVTVKASYLKWDNTKKELVATPMPDTYTTVQNANGDVSWSAGTYVVEGDVAINGNIKLKGNVELIIKDGYKLTVYGKIDGNMSYNLNVYGGKAMSGELAVYKDNDAIVRIVAFNIHSCKVIANCTSTSYGYGGVYAVSVLNVYGGLLDAQYTGASGEGYGISLANGGSLNIYDGEVIAVGNGDDGDVSYGICAYDSSESATVHFYGGKLYAACASKLAIKSNITLNNNSTIKTEYNEDGTSTGWKQTGSLTEARFVRIGDFSTVD